MRIETASATEFQLKDGVLRTRKEMNMRQYIVLITIAVIVTGIFGSSLSISKAKASDFEQIRRSKGTEEEMKEEYAKFQRYLISEYCKNEVLNNDVNRHTVEQKMLTCIFRLDYITARSNCIADAMLAREFGDNPKNLDKCMEEKGWPLHD